MGCCKGLGFQVLGFKGLRVWVLRMLGLFSLKFE